MFLRGLFSFQACAQVACEVRACLNLFTEGKQTAAWTRDRNYDTGVWIMIYFRSGRGLNSTNDPGPDIQQNAERESSNALPSTHAVIYCLVLAVVHQSDAKA
jgi:hypothetical protein